jgi:predicted ATP-grasp superfamily ATP-dependent carboligase
VACAGYDEALAILTRMVDRYWLIADSDHWLRFVVANRSSLRHATVLHPSNEAIETCLDKDRFTRWCEDAGFATPAMVDPQGRAIRFPVVVRPNVTRHREVDAPKAAVARDQTELEACIREYQNVHADFVVTEALIDRSTRYYAVGLARRKDGATLAFATEKVRPGVERCRGASYVETRVLPEAIALARRVADRLEFVGVGELEIAYRGGTFFLVELNPRPWLQYGLARALGLSMLGFAALGQAQVEPKGKASWISLGTDVYWCLSRTDGLVWNSRLSLPRFVAQVLTADCRLLWDWRDPLPFLCSALPGRRR